MNIHVQYTFSKASIQYCTLIINRCPLSFWRNGSAWKTSLTPKLEDGKWKTGVWIQEQRTFQLLLKPYYEQSSATARPGAGQKCALVARLAWNAHWPVGNARDSPAPTLRPLKWTTCPISLSDGRTADLVMSITCLFKGWSSVVSVVHFPLSSSKSL